MLPTNFCLSVTRDSGRSKPFEVDRRSTYRPSPSLDEVDTIFTTVCNSKMLEHVSIFWSGFLIHGCKLYQVDKFRLEWFAIVTTELFSLILFSIG